jgi:hypothetical protein
MLRRVHAAPFVISLPVARELVFKGIRRCARAARDASVGSRVALLRARDVRSMVATPLLTLNAHEDPR